jgi:hypothetical protein
MAEELELHASSASSPAAETGAIDLSFQTNAALKKSIELLSELCEESNSPVELLEVYRNVECALVRLGEWQQYFGSRFRSGRVLTFS